MRTPWVLVVLIMAFSVLVSCATKDPQNELGYALRGYERAFRFSEYDQAATFYRNPAEAMTPATRQKLEHIKISGYDVINGTMTGDKSIMVQTVRIRYFNDASYVERTIMDRQTWEYDKKAQKWYLTSELPKFR